MNDKTFYCQSTGRALQPMEDQRADGRQLFRELSATTESRVLTHPAMLATHPPPCTGRKGRITDKMWCVKTTARP